jgi:serine kinase of HPr protein (carbohydrate metabolism regulator)
MGPTIHASAVLVGARAVLIRGPSGAGKSQAAWALINAAPAHIPFARLVADDRAFLEAQHGRLIVRPAPELAGLMEIRGLGIRRMPFEPIAVLGLVVDLAAADAERLPAQPAQATEICGITLPRLAVAGSHSALPGLLAMLKSAAAGD